MGTDKRNVVEAVEIAFLMLRSRLMLRADSLSEPGGAKNYQMKQVRLQSKRAMVLSILFLSDL